MERTKKGGGQWPLTRKSKLNSRWKTAVLRRSGFSTRKRCRPTATSAPGRPSARRTRRSSRSAGARSRSSSRGITSLPAVAIPTTRATSRSSISTATGGARTGTGSATGGTATASWCVAERHFIYPSPFFCEGVCVCEKILFC